MDPRYLLRAEGAVVFALATAGFYWLEGPLWLYLLLILAPDLSMVGYLRGPAVGSTVYNVVHTYVLPVGPIAVSWWQGRTLGALVGLVWLAHIGADRVMAYGLKYPTGFKDTHLGSPGGEPALDQDPEPIPSR